MNMIKKIISHKALQLLQRHVAGAKLMKSTFRNILLHVISLAFIVMPSVAFSWSPDTSINTPISLAADDQASVVIAEDGAGGAVMAWTDYRNSSYRDIYAQAVDTTGAVQWTADGVAVSTATQTQYNPIIIGDGSGGAIIFWADKRNDPEPYSLYAQHIDVNGNAQWAADGVLVAATPGYIPSVASDGAGGAIVTWSDNTNKVFAQRINAAGEFWAGGAELISALGYRPSIASDGGGGAIISWTEGSGGVYAQRLNSSGVEQWAAGGAAVVSEADISEQNVAMVSDGQGGAVILLTRYRADPAISGYYVQKINANGVVQWSSPVWLTDGGYNTSPFISDGLGGAMISWWASSNYDPYNDRAIYVQGVDTDGNLRWTLDGLLVGHRPYGSVNDIVPIINDGAGGFIASWVITDSNFEWDLYGQHFNVDGLPQWGVEPVAISTSAGTQANPVIVGDGSGGTIFAWKDSRNGDQTDIYAHKFSSDGGSSGLQTPSNISPADGAQIDTATALLASAFVDDSGLLSHAASQWRINNINNMSPDIPEDAISSDDGNIIYQLPFSFPFFERNITSISANTNGLVELMEDGETSFEADGYGTHWDGDHIGNMDAIFAANDDLDMSNGYLRIYNGGTQIIIEWYGATFADDGNVNAYPMHFQVELHQDGWIAWNFNQLDFSSHDNDLYSGVYPNAGVEIDMSDTDLVNLVTPASFEFNPVSRTVNATIYRWFVPQPVVYDSGESSDLVSHLVPGTAGLEDSVNYYWGVRYKGDNDEWSLWSTPTSFSVDILAPIVITPTEPESSATDVAINTVIQATFSEEMDGGTVDTSSFTLTGPGGSISGTVDYAATIASLTPVDDLAYNTEYTAIITTAVTDTLGTQMVSPYSWIFTTGAEADLTAPTVVSFFPARNATDVGIDIGSVSVTFSEAINAATVNQNSFTLAGPDGAVAGTVSYDAATNTARFDPDALLAYSAAYTATITTVIQDIAGNALGLNDSWIFSASEAPPPPPPQDTVPPRVVSATPTGTEPVSASVGAISVTFSEAIQHIDTASFTVSASGNLVVGTVQYDETAMTAWFYPTADNLAFDTQFTVKVLSSQVRDLAGKYMLQDYVSYFTTGGDPVFAGCNPEIGEEYGCESFDYFTYGTGVDVDTYGSSITGLLAEYAARRSVSFGESFTTKENEPPSSAFESQATAIVNSTKFSLRSRSRRMELSEELAGAWSMGASKINVSGVPPGALIPMSIVTTGTFTGNGGSLMLQVRDFDSYTMLASETVVGSSGDIRVNFLYPAIPNNGIYVWFVAGVHSSLSSGETDYTATLEVNPPPGVTVTLASGQVFTGAVDTDGDGVPDSEDSSRYDASIASPPSATGTGSLTINVSDNAGATLSQIQVLDDDDSSLAQLGKPADQVFPDGLISFRLNGIETGGEATVTLTFPTAFADDPKYYKVNDTGFYELIYPYAAFSNDRKTVTLKITDGGIGDSDGVANGVIVDPGGVAVPLPIEDTPIEDSPVTTSSNSSNSSSSGLFGIGVFDPLMLLALFMWSIIDLVYRRRR